MFALLRIRPPATRGRKVGARRDWRHRVQVPNTLHAKEKHRSAGVATLRLSAIIALCKRFHCSSVFWIGYNEGSVTFRCTRQVRTPRFLQGFQFCSCFCPDRPTRRMVPITFCVFAPPLARNVYTRGPRARIVCSNSEGQSAGLRGSGFGASII